MPAEEEFLDKFSRLDDLMLESIPILREIRDKEIIIPQNEALTELAELLGYQHNVRYDVFTLNYPFDGTRLTITAGTTVYDFEHGTVSAPGTAVVKMSSSLEKKKRDFMRALTINADKDVIIQLDERDKIVVRAGSWPLFPYQRFRKVRVTATESTEILVSASTSADAIIQMYGEVSPSSAGFTGDVYENEHTMVDDTAYRFESSSLLLRDAVVRVSTHDALFGDTSNQRYPRSVGSTIGLTKLDLSKFYIKNAGAGSNTKINIFGTKV